MEPGQRERLSELVEELTTSGDPQLNQSKMKEVKHICKLSNDYIDHVYHSVMSQLRKEHAEIRLSAFQIASELFSRSHHFRTLLVNNLQEFLELTVETDLHNPLPPPKEVAKTLKTSAIRTIQSWQDSYGSGYKKLALGYHFLKQVKKVDFSDIQARTIVERIRVEETQRRIERIYRGKVDLTAKEMEESCQEIEATLTEMDTCLKLLLSDEFDTFYHKKSVTLPQKSKEDAKEVTHEGDELASMMDKMVGNKVEEVEQSPSPQEEESSDGQTSVQENKDSFIRISGLLSHSYSLDIEVNPEYCVKETEDNESLVTMLIDLHRLIKTKHLPAVQRWLQILTKSSMEQQLLRRALDLKALLESALQKHKHLTIDYMSTRVCRVIETPADSEDEKNDDESDLMEVPEKEGFEHSIPEHLREEYGVNPSPSSSTETTNKKPLARKPALSFSTSSTIPRQLEDDQDPTCAAESWSAAQHRFKVSCDEEEEEVDKNLSAGRSSISCNAPLTYGKLCPRQDRVKCPFHGVIVPRDADGRPTRIEDRQREEREKRSREEQPEWCELDLMRDIEAATGEDLGSNRKFGKGKGKKKKYRNLSDLKQSTNTSRSRLEKKVFNKSAMRRVTEVMNKVDRRKHDKFSNQFNYALN